MLTFLWHDYETFGKNTRTARPAQFAAIRTDENLNEIGAPLELFCQPAPDFLPEPEACLITGITPQRCLREGMPEHQFAAQVLQALAQPETIGVGYNTLRYDDEITRFMFWRNLLDPYSREWQNGCSRWDMIDLARVTYALRPEGIAWPRNEEGRVSFKLTDLTAANGIAHAAAHDAVSDVRATIALARLLRERQPKLFAFYFKLRLKDNVSAEIGLGTGKPFLHLSSMYPAERAHLALVFPLGVHPVNKNEIIVWDCAYDPAELLTLDSESIRQRLFTRAEELPPGVTRLPIKTIHLNKSPFVARDLRVLNAAAAARCQLDLALNQRHADWLAKHQGALAALASGVWKDVYQRDYAANDVDQALYDGFIERGDRATLNRLMRLSPQALAAEGPSFADARLEELLFRYRARNFPDTLSEDEFERWLQHCTDRLHHGAGGALTLSAYCQQLEQLAQSQPQQTPLLQDLNDYAQMIAPQGVKRAINSCLTL